MFLHPDFTEMRNVLWLLLHIQKVMLHYWQGLCVLKLKVTGNWACLWSAIQELIGSLPPAWILPISEILMIWYSRALEDLKLHKRDTFTSGQGNLINVWQEGQSKESGSILLRIHYGSFSRKEPVLPNGLINGTAEDLNHIAFTAQAKLNVLRFSGKPCKRERTLHVRSR